MTLGCKEHDKEYLRYRLVNMKETFMAQSGYSEKACRENYSWAEF
jgi:hypothetical protein